MSRRYSRHFVYATPDAIMPFRLGCGIAVESEATNFYHDSNGRGFRAFDETRHETVDCERCRRSPMFKDMVQSITDWPIAHKAKYGKERTP